MLTHRLLGRPLVAGAVLGGVLALMSPATPASAIPPPGTGPHPSGAAEVLELNRHVVGLLPARLEDPRLGNDVAIQVRTPDGGAVLFSSQSGEAQMPASNMKLVTALGALTTMGPSTALPTRVTLRGADAGVVLVGGGDPLLGSRELDALAQRTVTALTSSAGGVPPTTLVVHVDDRLFRDGTIAPGWRSTYVPGEVTYVRSLGRHGVLATDTAKDAGTYFVGRLKAYGVAATYGGRGAGALGAEVARVDGHTVAEAVAVMLRDSDNQVAETLFRHVALAQGQPATWAGGSVAALAVLRDHRLPTTGLRLLDGSGLSRSDRLNAAVLARLMALVQDESDTDLEGFVAALPVAGRTGTLAASNGRYTTAPSRCAAGLVHAKTGTLTGALALSGTAVGRDGNSRPFSIIVNHPPTDRYSQLTVRRAMDGLAATITGCW